MPFIALPIRRGSSFTGHGEELPNNMVSMMTYRVSPSVIRQLCQTRSPSGPYHVLQENYDMAACLPISLSEPCCGVQQEQETDNRKNWAAIGEAKSSSEDDKQHTAADGLDNSIQALREKNRSFFLFNLQCELQSMQGTDAMACVSSGMPQQLQACTESKDSR